MGYTITFLAGQSEIWSADMIANTVSLEWNKCQPFLKVESKSESTATGTLTGLSHQRPTINLDLMKFYIRNEVTASQDRDLYYELMNLFSQNYVWITDIGTDSERYAELQSNEITSLLAGSTKQTITALTRVGTTATATITGHGYATGDFLHIAAVGTWPDDITGNYQITVASSSTFTFETAIAYTTGTFTSGEAVQIGRGYSNWVLPLQIQNPQVPDLAYIENEASDSLSVQMQSKELYRPTYFG
ncbi:MAG: hypothetical protein GY853_14595 [PVC group bacterium]|nr:hypothetical protein [PVC group bacterium]